MHRERIITVTSVAVIAVCAAACGNRGGSEATSTAYLTSASVATQDSRPLDARIATALCGHEVECGRPQAGACIENTRHRVSDELSSWDCDPARRRASAEQCLASLRVESCSVDLVLRSNVCPLDVACRNAATSSEDMSRVVPPAPALADPWRP
jgi:hypothetical protein